jgi:hypothetical protein
MFIVDCAVFGKLRTESTQATDSFYVKLSGTYTSHLPQNSSSLEIFGQILIGEMEPIYTAHVGLMGNYEFMTWIGEILGSNLDRDGDCTMRFVVISSVTPDECQGYLE